MDKILESKNCKSCKTSFNTTQKDRDFYEKVSPVFWWKKYQIPDPTLCPDCREQRRFAWRNDRNLYKRVCDATGKTIISMFSPDKKFRVYQQDFWWSDSWELTDSWQDFDFSSNFFSQFHRLLESVPKRALLKWTGTENCDYTNLLWASRDGYYVFNGTSTDKCLYTDGASDVDSCTDCTQIRESSYCYESVDIMDCYNCSYILSSTGCSESSYLLNCINCSNCFACINLNNKKYHIFNKEYPKAEYDRKKKELIEKWFSFKDFQKYSLDFPRKNLDISASENVSGDIIHNAKNVHESYEVYDAENIRYGTYVIRGTHDAMDCTVCLNNSHRLYEMSLVNKNCMNLIFCHDCWNHCENLIYCSECKLTKNCFWCTGLVWKQYCILNKQYTKQEYEELVPRIIDHIKKTQEWGEFFPMSISPFGYNETFASLYYPMTQSKVEERWWNWSSYEAPLPKVDKIIPANKLPKDIKQIPDDILNWAIECEVTKKPFRVIRQELEFYRKHKLPIPKRHPDQRHIDRMKLRNPRKLYDRNCDKCSKDMQTSYAPERPEKVYCEACYNKEFS